MSKKVSVDFPFGLGSAEWEPDETERYAAWSLYVELQGATSPRKARPRGG